MESIPRSTHDSTSQTRTNKHMKLVIKGEITSYNEYSDTQRANRYAGAKVKKAETERVYWHCREQKLSAVLGKVDYTFTWYMADQRKDPDNIHSAIKFILDGLFKAGIIESDRQKHVGRVVHEEIQVDPKNPRVEVVMTARRGA